MASNLLVWAQAGLGGGTVAQIALFGGIFLVMYFLMIRPQQKQAKELQTMVSSLKKGDKVVTQGGLLGKIFAVYDKEISLEIATGVKVQVLKASVQGKVGPAEEPPVIASSSSKVEEKEDK